MGLTKVPKIYYLCPDASKQFGGIKQIYRHVDILNKGGFAAFVLHARRGFRCIWFENNTPVVYNSKIPDSLLPIEEIGTISTLNKYLFLIKMILLKLQRIIQNWQALFIQDIQIDKDDYLVIPENYGPKIAEIEKGKKKIIFNQNAHTAFLGYKNGKDEVATPYLDNEVMATMVVSDHSLRYLKTMFPQHKVVRVYNAVDPKNFYYSSHKKKQIVYMPRKLPEESRQIITALKFRGSIDDFEIIAIDNKSEKEVAAIMRDSLIFLSFSYQEGCPLPPMEAMACGCIVIGYDGYGGREYFKNEFCYPVTCGDEIVFIDKIEHVINEYRKDRNVILEKGRIASEYILRVYSMEKETTSILNFWKEIIELHSTL